ncbi:MAG TPA: pyridoxamine 5'-phosphate oxidase family protein [Jatrophihabitans sp.]|nr:pyridoxamine 5'-phosphate oxidase family protein [Jatrophihabitans sp.]
MTSIEPSETGPSETGPSETGSSRTTPTRYPERVSGTNEPELHRLLDQSRIGHVGFVSSAGQPVVLPIAIARDGADVLMHGSTGSSWLRRLAEGVPVSLAVTALDALVVARSAFESSMRYRSAVLFGSCRPVLDPEQKGRALNTLTDSLIPGRVAEVRPFTAKELAATLVLRLVVEDYSIKISQRWPDDPPEDVQGPAWAGVLPAQTRYIAAWPAPDLVDGVELPASVRALLEPPD